MKFLIYKVYRIALTQQKSIGTTFAFLLYMSMFEILHLLILALGIKTIGCSIIVPKGYFFSTMIVCLLCFINYLFFIRNNRIYRINSYYQNKNLKVWKGNIVFIAYIFFLMILVILSVYLYQIVINK